MHTCGSQSLRRYVALALLALPGVACVRAEKPEQAARQYSQAFLAGDRVSARGLLSRSDSIALASNEMREFARATFGQPDAGTPGARVDSTKTIRIASDSAAIAVFISEPNWETVGGRFEYGATGRIDRALDPDAVAKLSLAVRIDTVSLVRERGVGWRVVYRAQFQFETSMLFRRALDVDAPPHERSEAISRMRTLFGTNGVQIDASLESMLHSLESAIIYADSIDHRIVVASAPRLFAGGPTKEFNGYVRNNSRRAIRSLEIEVRFSSGERETVFLSNIAPGMSKEPLGFGNWSGSIVSARLKSIDFEAE